MTLQNTYFALNVVGYQRTQVGRPQTNEFVEWLNCTVLDEIFCSAFRTKYYDSAEALQHDLDIWLVHYNTERSHQG